MAMDINYGIGVKNRYALFMGDEESDPLDIISKCKEEVTSGSAAGDKGALTTGSHQLSMAGVKTGTKKDANKKSSAGQSATNITSTSHSASGNAGNENKTGGSGTGALKSKQQSQQHANPNSNKFNSVSNGKQQNKDTNSQNNNSATSNRKGGENRYQNRPPRQDRQQQQQQQKPQNTNFGGSTQDNSWSPSNWVAPKEQKDIDEKKNKRNREDRQPFYQNTDFNREKGEEGKGKVGRQAVRGAFRGRGGRGGGRNFDNRGKREFDRQSGSDKTGIKPNEKREGSGSFNWGTFNDDIEGQTNPTQDENQEKSGDENLFETDGKENESGNEEMEKGKELDENAEEDAVKEMTYDEWKKIEEEKRAKPIFNLRKPGEGEDVAQWKNTYVLKKKDDEDDDEEVEEVEYIEEEEVKHGRQKRILDIEINFKDENRDSRRGRGRGPRGGANRGTALTPGERRGGERDRGDRDRDRPERGQGTRRGHQMRGGRDSKEQPALRVDVNNIIDFPSLAAV